MSIKVRLIIMNFLEYAAWGAYLTCMGRFLGSHGLGANIGWFYSIQGIVSLFMPALMGIVADRWIPAQKVLSLCHALAGLFMIAACWYCINAGEGLQFAPLFSLYTISVAFYMPTIALSNSVAFNGLVSNGFDTVKDFPPIRVFGTIGFIATMWCVDILEYQSTAYQFAVSGGISLVLACYALTLPHCPIKSGSENKSLVEALGLQAFSLFKQKKMAIFFVFSMLLGMCLQVTNGYANPFLGSFEYFKEWTHSFGVEHSNILISISQISEALCILAIPFFLKRFGIKNVMLMAMFAWVFRFGFFGLGDPGFPGVILFVLSCIIYGFAFDFFNISGALYVDQETDVSIRSSAQGLFMMMTNGLGATIGTLSAQAIVNNVVPVMDDQALGIIRDVERKIDWSAISSDLLPAIEQAAHTTWTGWQIAWGIFAAFALVVAILFWIVFPQTKKIEGEVKH